MTAAYRFDGSRYQYVPIRPSGPTMTGPTNLTPPTEHQVRAAATEAVALHDAAQTLRSWAAALDNAAEANP